MNDICQQFRINISRDQRLAISRVRSSRSLCNHVGLYMYMYVFMYVCLPVNLIAKANNSITNVLPLNASCS